MDHPVAAASTPILLHEYRELDDPTFEKAFQKAEAVYKAKKKEVDEEAHRRAKDGLMQIGRKESSGLQDMQREQTEELNAALEEQRIKLRAQQNQFERLLKLVDSDKLIEVEELDELKHTDEILIVEKELNADRHINNIALILQTTKPECSVQ